MTTANINTTDRPAAATASHASPPPAARHVVLVLSGKGGVGKSTVSASLALALALASSGGDGSRRLRVGILDIDLTGPSVPRMLGLADARVHQGSRGWVPVHVPLPGAAAAAAAAAASPAAAGDHAGAPGSLACMSIGFLLRDKSDAVIWRGPKKTAMIRQFLQDVDWGTEPLDYLIVDTPPGTGDEHIALVENLRDGWNVDGAVLVTTPQVGIRVLGIVENMSGYVCPHCAVEFIHRMLYPCLCLTEY
ncbi:cytosolic Fe-S cluster assembly factor cfd1 [Entophlyctis luteolus]|nr:cytosolic Fe-S cluster assembly factor cfd1 [Entophlyctis luteolus]